MTIGPASRQKRLQAFIDAIGDSAVTWGKDDCSAAAANWVRAETGRPVGLPDYSGKAAAMQLIEDAGGLENLWERALVPTGLMQGWPAGTPSLGDIGIVDTRLYGPVGVIFCAFGTAFWRAEEGYSFFTPRASHILKWWSVPMPNVCEVELR